MFVILPIDEDSFTTIISSSNRTLKVRLSATDFDLINGRCRDSLYGLVGFLFIQLISVPVSAMSVILPIEENAFSINIS